jgi:allantoate deiminase
MLTREQMPGPKKKTTQMTNTQSRAQKIFSRIAELAAITEEPGMITRTYGSNAFVEASKIVQMWMQSAGLQTTIDNIGNVRGRWLSNHPNAKTFIIASHIDTVKNAGRFDGPLGVVMGLDAIENIIENKAVLPFNIELIAFCDEEGIRFHTTFLGSKVVAGSFDATLLTKRDNEGTTLAEIIKKLRGNEAALMDDRLQDDVMGYFEIHIEQGPVLYEANIPVAVVTAIAGQKRIELVFTGTAGHAGTVPMEMRRDALSAAAACISAIEDFAIDHKTTIVATVGKLDVANAASNVIPGNVTCTLDIRSADDVRLAFSCNALQNILAEICEDRNILFEWNTIQETAPVLCNTTLNDLLKQSIKSAGFEVVELVSGAGHDAVPMSAICPVSMLFVRCFKGISHHPLEDVDIKDITAAIEVTDHFLLNLASTYNK